MLNVTFLIRKRFRSLLVRSELFGINMRYQELFKKTADVVDEGETICIFFFEQYDIQSFLDLSSTVFVYAQ